MTKRLKISLITIILFIGIAAGAFFAYVSVYQDNRKK